mgnify:CR=1 FL=1
MGSDGECDSNTRQILGNSVFVEALEFKDKIFKIPNVGKRKKLFLNILVDFISVFRLFT